MEKRRNRILDTATKIFSRKGYRLTDVQEIADRLKIGKGTVYRLFVSKEKLFTSIIERGMKQLVAEIQKKMAGVINPLDKLRLAIQTHMNFFNLNIELGELFIQMRSEFNQNFTPLYQKYYQEHAKGVEKIQSYPGSARSIRTNLSVAGIVLISRPER